MSISRAPLSYLPPRGYPMDKPIDLFSLGPTIGTHMTPLLLV